MNKKKILFNVVILFVFALMFSLINNVQANTLKFLGDVTGDSDDCVYINTITVPYDDEKVNRVGLGNWDYDVILNTGGNEYSWDAYAMVFHKEPLSNYTTTTNANNITMRYDTYSGYLKLLDVSDLSSGNMLNIKFGSVGVSNVTSSKDISSLESSGKAAVVRFQPNIKRADPDYEKSGAYIDRVMYVATSPSSGITSDTQITRWAIRKDFILNTILKNPNLYEIVDVNGRSYYRTMFSEMAKTDADPKHEWNNAAEAFDNIVNYGRYTSSNRGTYWGDMHGIKYTFGSDGGKYLLASKDPLYATSMLNVYDNYLYIPMSLTGKNYKVVFVQEDLNGNLKEIPGRTVSGTFTKENGTLVDQDGNTFGSNISIPTIQDYTFGGISYKSSQTMPGIEEVVNTSGNKTSSMEELRKQLEDKYDNLSDNTLIVVKYNQEPPKKVYVRHLVKDSNGNYTILDSRLTDLNQTLIDSNSNNAKKIINNGYNKLTGTTNAIPSGYSEFYTIGLRDSMIVDKSRTIIYENDVYTYNGYKMGSSTNLSTAMTNKDRSQTVSKPQATVSGNNTYYCIDFYYTKTTQGTPSNPNNPVTPPETPGEPADPDGTGITPSLDIDPKKDGEDLGSTSIGANGTCKVAYVPAGEQIKPYVTTPTYKAYTLVYNLIGFNSDGSNKYDIYTYDTYRLTGARVDNSTADESTKYFVSNSPNGVVNGNNSVSLSYNVDVNSKIIASRDSLKNQSPLTTVNVPAGANVTKDDYTTILNVPSNKYNGLREPVGRATYDIVSVVSRGNNTSLNRVANTGVSTVTALNNTKVNVYTPLVIGDAKIVSEGSVNHSNKDQGIIQKNTKFTLTPTIASGKNSGYAKIKSEDTYKYLSHYIVMFDFDVQLTNGRVIKAGEKIRVEKGGSIEATPSSGFDENSENKTDSLSSSGNHVKIIGVTYNLPSSNFENAVLDKVTITSTKDEHVDNNYIIQVTYLCDGNKKVNHADLGLNMSQDSNYFAKVTQDIINIGRIYDFEVTDCLDVNFKNVFRNINSTTGEVNSITGTVYFSGIKQLRIYGNGNNVITDRTNIDKVPSKLIIPLGPYKHTAGNYVQAPKLGYRISFDLKTSGKYSKSDSSDNSRYIEIKPSYYYISKDGNTFNDNIELYYKNSSGKYVKFIGSGYTIYFKPNDGYRYGTTNETTSNISTMSTKLEPLKIGSDSFRLTDDMMSTSDDNYIQSWYGEFKLPNSTLALPSGESDLNKALTNGYIGVKFNITCVDTKNDIRVSYNQNDKSTGKGNTSQWDYEGFMGFSTPGADMPANSLGLQLESGTWKIADNNMYNKIKGTVVLYDTDNRAANDFE